MLNHTLSEIFERDLLKLKEEINLYRNESDLWLIEKQISNSAGNLCLHIIGNLNHFVGATLGNSGYLRQRDLEFTSKNVSREMLNKELDNVIAVVKNVIGRLKAADFERDFPLKKHDRIVSTEHMLVHLLAHLSYHLGQVNYHRRLVAAD